MADMLNTGVSALLAFQEALDTTSNNISNVNTPGYSRESVNLVSVPGQTIGTSNIGNGVAVTAIQRDYNQALANQANTANSGYNQLNVFATQAAQIDNLLGSTTSGLSTQLQSFVSAIENVANTPTSSASRQALLSQAQQLVSNLQSDDSSLKTIDSQTNQALSSNIGQISSLASSIAQLNSQIMADTSQSAPAPNTLLDQRDQLINQLSGLVTVQTSPQSDGTLNVYIGSGQALVTGTSANQLVSIPNQYDPNETDVGLQSGSSTVDITSQVTGGTVGGLLQFRSQMLQPTENSLGQLAVVLSNAVNTQNEAGLDQNGNLGQAMFAVGGVGVQPSANNTGSATVAATITSPNSITDSNYILHDGASGWTLTDAGSGASVTMGGSGISADPFTADGMSIVVSGTATAGDTFQIEPTSGAVQGMSVLLTNPSQIAAAAPLVSAATSTNTGSGSIDQGSVTSGYGTDDYSVQFTSPSAYQIMDTTTGSTTPVATGTYTSGSPITFNGITATISGAPATGDSFTVQNNGTGSGDNRNANTMAGLLDQPLIGGSESINGAVNGLITNIGIQTSQAQTGASAQQTVLNDANSAQQSVSGVNLDEEAANLVQYQQAYEAAAQVIKTASTLFQSILSAVQAG